MNAIKPQVGSKHSLGSFGMDAIIYESEGHPKSLLDYQTSRPEAKTIFVYGGRCSAS
ncbi:MAG: hypothetical protein CM15mP73_0360 [Hyphomicrobiales bacterium]|nr:MAG: hypothetical protein CM15mP73_0360 [Hyphomicrobiales bacterium]